MDLLADAVQCCEMQPPRPLRPPGVWTVTTEPLTLSTPRPLPPPGLTMQHNTPPPVPPLPPTIPSPTTYLMPLARRGLNDEEPDVCMPQAKVSKLATEGMNRNGGDGAADTTQAQRGDGHKRLGTELPSVAAKHGNHRSGSVPPHERQQNFAAMSETLIATTEEEKTMGQCNKRRCEEEEEDDWYAHPEASSSSGPCPPRRLRRIAEASVPPTMSWDGFPACSKTTWV